MKKRHLSTKNLVDFLQLESRYSWRDVQRVLNADPENSLATGEVLGPLKAVNRDKRGLVLRATGIYFSRFRPGDQPDVACISARTRKFQKVSPKTTVRDIRYPAPGILEVVVSGILLPNEDTELFLLPSNSPSIIGSLQTKLLNLQNGNGSAIHQPINHARVLENFTQATEGLNATQIDALKFLRDNDFKGLVQGPPGTGKTHLLTALVHLALESGLRVGLASFGHTAIDNALARILEGIVNNDWVARIASNPEKVKTEPYRKLGISLPVYRSFKDLEDDDGDIRLYAATMHVWCMTNSLPEIDILIIDEASQVPLYFYPFFEKISSRIIMFGDHKQLPPVIQLPKHDLPAEDVFSFEIEQGSYPMLETQYRMNSKIQHWSSHRFYDGRLQPHAKNRERDVLHGLPSTSGLLGTHQVNLVSHQGRANHHRNQHEASRVADLVSALQVEGKVPLSEIGIVTPHRAQAGAIYNELQQKLGLERSTHVLVDTVERFQGQEREAMIFSVGVESDNAKPGEKEFLGDGRRLNVAVTRARSRFYCFASEVLVDRTLARSGDGHLKSLIAWCDSSNTTKTRNSKNTA